MISLGLFVLSVGLAGAIAFGVAAARSRSTRACGRRDSCR
jgi:hypothetical protein